MVASLADDVYVVGVAPWQSVVVPEGAEGVPTIGVITTVVEAVPEHPFNARTVT